jgi:hypothetical protein
MVRLALGDACRMPWPDEFDTEKAAKGRVERLVPGSDACGLGATMAAKVIVCLIALRMAM